MSLGTDTSLIDVHIISELHQETYVRSFVVLMVCCSIPLFNTKSAAKCANLVRQRGPQQGNMTYEVSQDFTKILKISE